MVALHVTSTFDDERDVAVVLAVAAPVIPPTVILVESSRLSCVNAMPCLALIAMPLNDSSLHLHLDPPLPRRLLICTAGQH
jgi:hypothetical protein